MKEERFLYIATVDGWHHLENDGTTGDKVNPEIRIDLETAREFEKIRKAKEKEKGKVGEQLTFDFPS